MMITPVHEQHSYVATLYGINFSDEILACMVELCIWDTWLY